MRGEGEPAMRVSPQSLSVFTLLAPVSSFDCSPFLTYAKMRAVLKSGRLHAGFFSIFEGREATTGNESAVRRLF